MLLSAQGIYTNSRLKLDKAGGWGVPDQGSPDAGICGYWGRADTEQGRPGRWICLIFIKI